MKALLLLIPFVVFVLASIFGGWVSFVAGLVAGGLLLYAFLTLKRYDLIVPFIGIVMNGIAIASNHWQMPVLNPPSSVLDAAHVEMTEQTKFKPFGDTIPIGDQAVISLGDIFIAGIWPLTIGALYGYNKYKLKQRA